MPTKLVTLFAPEPPGAGRAGAVDIKFKFYCKFELQRAQLIQRVLVYTPNLKCDSYNSFIGRQKTERDYNHKAWSRVKYSFSVVRCCAQWRATGARVLYAHLSLLASLSDSRRARMSPFLTGPLTFLTRVLLTVPMKLTLTCVIPPLEPRQS